MNVVVPNHDGTAEEILESLGRLLKRNYGAGH